MTALLSFFFLLSIVSQSSFIIPSVQFIVYSGSGQKDNMEICPQFPEQSV